jgi:outer membrane protein
MSRAVVRQVLIGLVASGWLALGTGTHARAQRSDSLRIFSYADYLELVLRNHPIVQQADLLPEEARAELMQARGELDPKLASSFNQKQLKDTEYYTRWETELKVPTWSGIDLQAGYDRGVGRYISGENRTSEYGLMYAGVSVPLAQGLLIDARRATIRQARLFVDLREAERIGALNKALLSAAKTYWDWYFSYQQFRLLQEGYELANIRYRGIAQRVELGDAAPIDSVEAQITAQDRLVQLEQATIEWQNARLALSNFLWTADGRPAEIPVGTIPGGATFRTVDDDDLQAFVARARQQHPDLLKLDFTLRQLDIEQRFRRNQLLPTINLKYNFLREPAPGSSTNGVGPFWLANDYKAGLDFYFPLFLRKERGKLWQTRVKIDQYGFDRQQIGLEVINGVYQAYNQVTGYARQLTVQELAVANQRRLLQAEQQKFELGESSIFLINVRETKLFEMNIKLEDLRAKYEKSLAELAFAAGQQPR